MKNVMRVSERSEILITLSVMFIRRLIFFTALVGVIWSCDKDEDPAEPARLELLKIFVGTTEINLSGTITKGLPLDRSITLNFSQPLDQATVSTGVVLKKAGQTVNTTINLTSGGSTAVVFPA